MENIELEHELDKLKTDLRAEANKYTDAISNKDREQINLLQTTINELLKEIKSKSALYRSSMAA